MPLSKIIAGPILRRVDKKSVSVWLAFTEEANLTLKLYDNADVKLKAGIDGNASNLDGSFTELNTTSAQANTIQIGKRIWVAVVTAKLPLSLQSNKIYSYNVEFSLQSTPGEKKDLRTEGFLSSDKPDAGDNPNMLQLPLGYKKNILPNFLLPSDEPENLFITQASCRKMHGHGNDALANLDKIIKDNRTNHKDRPQQLFLTGDQVYADDVPGPLIRFLGVHSGLSLTVDEKVSIENGSGVAQDVAVDINNFPPYLRQDLIIDSAFMSSTAADNHIIGFGEYCALYLNYWNIRSWHEDLLAIIKTIQDDNKDSVLQTAATNILDSNDLRYDSSLINIYNSIPDTRSNLFQLHFDKNSKALYQVKPVEIDNPGEQTARRTRWLEKINKKLKSDLKEMASFVTTLPKVSRVLANVPCYMIFDDHEITDDWYLSKRWKNQVLSKQFGRDIIRNGLMAYSVFQDWGNVPDEYVATPAEGENTNNLSARSKLLRKTSAYAAALTNDPVPPNIKTSILSPVENLLGMGSEEAEVKWHYSVNTGRAKTFVLDTRTQREYRTLNSPPGLLSEQALDEQLPDSIPGGTAPFTLVISPAPVLGIGGIEELVQPAAAAVFGIKNTDGRNPGFAGGMLDSDYEAWGFNTNAFEALIERMSELEKVIILSGDVHYGFSARLDFWEDETTPKARILQFTSSSLKNEEFGPVSLYRSAIIQKLLTGIGDNMEKLGWKDKVLTIDGNASIKNRHRLRQNPAVIPVAGWTPGTTINLEPDYRWRFKMITDNSVREPHAITEDLNLDDPTSVKQGYENIVQRHQESFVTGIHRRMVWPANVGLLRFKKEADNSLTAKHDFLFQKRVRIGEPEDSDIGTHIKHEAELVTPTADATRPELP